MTTSTSLVCKKWGTKEGQQRSLARGMVCNQVGTTERKTEEFSRRSSVSGTCVYLKNWMSHAQNDLSPTHSRSGAGGRLDRLRNSSASQILQGKKQKEGSRPKTERVGKRLGENEETTTGGGENGKETQSASQLAGL